MKGDWLASGRRCYSLGVDYTLTQPGKEGLDIFIEDITSRFPGIDFVRFGAVIPSGIAAEEDFAEHGLLTTAELTEIASAGESLAAHARSDTEVTVTDVRYFLPDSPLSEIGLSIASIEADGQLRAFPIYEAKVGNVLEEPLDVLRQRALEWRAQPFVVEQIGSIRSMADWARVTRTLDRRYGSPEDRARIARRGQRGAKTRAGRALPLDPGGGPVGPFPAGFVDRANHLAAPPPVTPGGLI